MPDIEPIVTPARYEVSCLPEGHRNRRHFTVELHYHGEGRWAVTDIFGDRYDVDGVHVSETLVSGSRIVAKPHGETLMDFDTALALARRIAPTLEVNGRTVADVLAQSEGRHG